MYTIEEYNNPIVLSKYAIELSDIKRFYQYNIYCNDNGTNDVLTEQNN